MSLDRIAKNIIISALVCCPCVFAELFTGEFTRSWNVLKRTTTTYYAFSSSDVDSVEDRTKLWDLAVLQILPLSGNVYLGIWSPSIYKHSEPWDAVVSAPVALYEDLIFGFVSRVRVRVPVDSVSEENISSVFVIYTQNKTYAKLRVVDIDSSSTALGGFSFVKFQWVLQSDGSRNLNYKTGISYRVNEMALGPHESSNSFGSTRLNFNHKEAATIRIYNLNGRLIKSFRNTNSSSVLWNSSTYGGRYIIQVESPSRVISKKLILK